MVYNYCYIQLNFHVGNLNHDNNQQFLKQAKEYDRGYLMKFEVHNKGYNVYLRVLTDKHHFDSMFVISGKIKLLVNVTGEVTITSVKKRQSKKCD